MEAIQLAELLNLVDKRLRHGCGNHGCSVKPPKGMGTNAVCKCDPASIARMLRSFATLCDIQVKDNKNLWD